MNQGAVSVAATSLPSCPAIGCLPSQCCAIRVTVIARTGSLAHMQEATMNEPMKLMREFAIPCPRDTNGDGNCAWCSKPDNVHKRWEKVPYSGVPWCAEHDSEWFKDEPTCNWPVSSEPCRLENPPRHIVLEPTEGTQ